MINVYLFSSEIQTSSLHWNWSAWNLKTMSRKRILARSTSTTSQPGDKSVREVANTLWQRAVTIVKALNLSMPDFFTKNWHFQKKYFLYRQCFLTLGWKLRSFVWQEISTIFFCLLGFSNQNCCLIMLWDVCACHGVTNKNLKRNRSPMNKIVIFQVLLNEGWVGLTV